MLTFKQWLAEQTRTSANQQSTKHPNKSLAAIIKEQTAPVPQKKTLKQLRESIAARTK